MEDRLTVLAEISVGLAGFSSVVVAFRRRTSSGAWKPEDVFRFKIMLESGLVAGFFAVLPAAISGLDVAPARMWPALIGLLLVYMTFDIARRRRQLLALPRRSLNPRVTLVTGVANVSVIGVVALGLVGWLVPRGPGTYLFGVTWLAVYSGVTFYRLVIAPIDDSIGEGRAAAAAEGG